MAPDKTPNEDILPRNPKPEDPGVTLGRLRDALRSPKPEEKPLEDWRERYHTFDQLNDAPPITFLIDGFLTENGVTAIAAPVAQRKSLIAMNVVDSLLTGDPLFGYFQVTKKPERVLYLCPEMGVQSFAERLRNMNLIRFVGKTLFCSTMSSDAIDLSDLRTDELTGSVVVLDTAIRFLQGDENSSDDMRRFAAGIFRLIKEGALSVILLHHSAKGTKESLDLTLENTMRGSGELGAFLACCWATRLQDPNEPYTSASYLKNVKQRDFASKPFTAASDDTGRMAIIGQPGEVSLRVNVGNKDGRESEAVEFIRSNPDLSVRKTVEALANMGVRRGRDWVAQKKHSVLGTGVTVSEVSDG